MAEKQTKSKKLSGSTRHIRLGRSNLVIGLTGPFGSGCSSMLCILKKDFDFVPFKISEDIRKEIKESGKLIEKGELGWRRSLQEHGDKRREKDRAY